MPMNLRPWFQRAANVSKFVEPDSALDWMTVRQLCESAGSELLEAHPDNPRLGRIDLFREVDVGGRRLVVRCKLTLSYVGPS